MRFRRRTLLAAPSFSPLLLTGVVSSDEIDLMAGRSLGSMLAARITDEHKPHEGVDLVCRERVGFTVLLRLESIQRCAIVLICRTEVSVPVHDQPCATMGHLS